MATTAIALQPTPAIPHPTATTTPHLTATATPRLTGTATPRRTWATPHHTSVTRLISATPERSVIKSGAYVIRALPDLCLWIVSRHLDVPLGVLSCLEAPVIPGLSFTRCVSAGHAPAGRVAPCLRRYLFRPS